MPRHHHHDSFLQALQTLRVVTVRFTKVATGEVVSRQCWPLDFGPANNALREKYSLINATGGSGRHVMTLDPDQIHEIHMTDSIFEPQNVYRIVPYGFQWHISRSW